MFNSKKKQVKNEQIAKDFIVKEMLDPTSHKKIVISAARKSSEDQEKLIRKYDELVLDQQ